MAGIAIRIFLSADDTGLGKNGNYSDSSGRKYSWDNYVQNHALPKIGDVIFIRSKTQVIGVSMIARLTKSPSYKIRPRCPFCDSTKIKWSRPKQSFRCPCKEVFEIPKLDYLGDVETYQADYEWFFTPLPELGVEAVRQVASKPKSIHSIQTAKTDQALHLLPPMAAWRLGFITINGTRLRRSKISLAQVTKAVPADTDECSITGIHAPGQIVTMKAITFSVGEGHFEFNADLKVLNVIAHALQNGECEFLESTGDLVLQLATPQGLMQFLYPTRKATGEAARWLSSYQGLGSN